MKNVPQTCLKRTGLIGSEMIKNERVMKMELSYEETMRRIEQYETDDRSRYIEGLKAWDFDEERTLYEINKYDRKFKYNYCREKNFPYCVDVYKGEHQLLISPMITTIAYYSTCMAWYRRLDDTETPEMLGKTILEAFEHIRISPVDARTPAEREEDLSYMKETKCKSYRAFNRKYLCCEVRMDENGRYSVLALGNSSDNCGYGDTDDCGKDADLPAGTPAEKIGEAVLAALDSSEDYLKAKKSYLNYPEKEELLCGKKVKYFPPKSSRFTDCGDGNSAEIYKLYEYSSKEGAAPYAELYLGIAAELNCDLSEENIRTVREGIYGRADSFEITAGKFGIFTLRADMRNNKIRIVSYLLQIDESELLECTLEVDSPDRRKKTEEKLIDTFEEFASECRLVP